MYVSGTFDTTENETDANDRVPDGFTFERVLGEGGFGRVVMARRDRDGRIVALKTAEPKARGAVASLRREERALAMLDGRGSPSLVDSGSWPDGGQWLAMDVVPGIPWPGAPHDGGSVPLETGLDRFEQLLGTLQRVHEAGLVHCDLKPENIFVHDDGVTLIDFGLSHRRGSDDQHNLGEVVGTAYYMSPEQCTPGVQVDVRSDVYAAAVLLYAFLTGAPPFEGSAEEIREAHRSRRPSALSPCGVPAEIDELLLRCLAKDPELRPATVGSFAEELGRARATTGSFRIHQTERKQAPKANQSDKQQVGLLWFRSDNPAIGLRSAIQDSGGHLVQARGTEYVAAYTRSGSDNPIRAALAAGNVLIGRGLVGNVLVDIDEVTVRRKPNGDERISGRVFRGPGRYLDDKAPRGLYGTTAAARYLPDVDQRPLPGRPDVQRLGAEASGRDVTVIGDAPCPLFGRSWEVARLQQQAARTRDRIPGLATVIGERGFGKSRLARELIELWEPGGASTKLVPFRAPDPMQGGRGAALRGLLTSVLPLPAERPDDVDALLQQQLGVRLSDDVSLGVSFAMGWIGDDHPVIRKMRAAPGAIRSMLARALGEILLQRARAQPLHVVIDDGQFLDDAALDALEYATRAEVRAPLWVCIFTRPGFLDSRPAWGVHAGTQERFELSALPDREASALVRHLLNQATNLSASVVQRLVDRTRGVPLVIVELLRALKREGLLRRGERGRGWVVDTEALYGRSDVPLVQWLMAREIDALSQDLRGHAGLASVLGPSFSIERLEDVMRELERTGEMLPSDLDPAIGVERLRRAGLLLENGGTYEFRQDILREGAYGTISEELRRATHHAAYCVVERDVHLGEDERLSQLAFHAAGAGLQEEAVELQLTLAHRAVDRHDYLVAQEAFKRAIDDLDLDDPRCLSAIHGLGLMKFRLGEHDNALRDLQRARERAKERPTRDDEVDILLDTAMVLDWAEDYPTSRNLVDEARDIIGDDCPPPLRARLLLGTGRSRFRLGDAEGATALLKKAAQVAESVGETAYETQVISLLLAATLAGLTGREESPAMFDELLALCTAHGDQLHLATGYLNRCVVWLASGDLEPLVADLRQAIGVARSAGYPLLETRALFNLGEISYMVGRYDEALEHTHQAIDLATQSQGEAQRVVVSRLLLARIHLLAGHPSKAAGEIRQIQEVQEQRRREGAVDTDFMPSDQALYRMVTLALAPSTPEEWDRLVEETETASMQQELVEVLEIGGWSCWKQGRLAHASHFLQRAAEEAERHPTLLKGRIAARRRDLEAELARTG